MFERDLSTSAAPVGVVSSRTHQQGEAFNLAANLIIQIAAYLMELKQSVEEEKRKAVLFICSL